MGDRLAELLNGVMRAEDAQPANSKCCGKCAFRRGSPERSDPYGWLALAERLDDGGVFLCHESVLGHPQEAQDGTPRLRLCRGFTATRHLGASRLLDMAIRDMRESEKEGRGDA